MSSSPTYPPMITLARLQDMIAAFIRRNPRCDLNGVYIACVNDPTDCFHPVESMVSVARWQLCHTRKKRKSVTARRGMPGHPAFWLSSLKLFPATNVPLDRLAIAVGPTGSYRVQELN